MNIEPRRKAKRSDLALTAIVAGYVLWGCAFVYRSSFVINGVRYFCLLDDEMISMRYAKHLAQGYGLVFNRGGERVEGFTNLMWVLYMALLHLLPVSPSKISLLVQLSGLALLAINTIVIARLAELVSGSRRVGLAAAFLSAFYVAINNWGLQGSEVAPLTLLISAIALIAIQCVQKQTSPIPLYLLMGFATSFRVDAFLPCLVVLGMLAVVDERRRFQHAVTGTLILALLVAAQTGFNFYYYGYPFPNTYYLKLTGFPLIPRVTRGAIATYRFVMELNPLLPVLVILLIYLRRDWRLLLLGLIVATVLAYNVWIGADFVEGAGGSNRFLAIVMPLFFVLLSCGLDACATAFALTFPKFVPIARLGTSGAFAVLTVLALITVDLPIRNEALGFGFNDYDSLPLASLALLNPPTGVSVNDLDVQVALEVEQLTDPDARIMVAGAGVVPYFTDRFSVEVLGKTDRVIAHESWKPMRDGDVWQSFLPGHFKWDYAYAIGEKQPDLIVKLVGWDEQSAQPFLINYHRLDAYYARNGSPHVHFAVLNDSTAPNLDTLRKEMKDRLAIIREQQAQPKH
jgi:arabinofuranosyltransferase